MSTEFARACAAVAASESAPAKTTKLRPLSLKDALEKGERFRVETPAWAYYGVVVHLGADYVVLSDALREHRPGLCLPAEFDPPGETYLRLDSVVGARRWDGPFPPQAKMGPPPPDADGDGDARPDGPGR